jgi:hypothetical protein
MYPKSAQKWRERQPSGIFKTKEEAAIAHWMSLLSFKDFENESLDRANSFSAYEDWMSQSSTEPWAFVRTTAPGMQGRLTVMSRKGYVISGPENTQAGDIFLCAIWV